MSIYRLSLLNLLACALAQLLTATAAAQNRIPTENTLEDLQLFAPVEASNYSDRPYLKEGLFLTHEYLVWSVQRPKVAVLGDPNRTRQVFNPTTFVRFTENNAVDTGSFQDLVQTGYRTQIGYIDDECCGWILGQTELHQRGQRFVHSNVPVIFNDPQNITASNFLQFQASNGVFYDADLDGDRIYGADGEDLGTPIGLFTPVPIGFTFPTPHPNPADPGTTNATNPAVFPSAVPNTNRPPHALFSLGDGIRPGFYLPYDGIPDSFPNGSVPDGGDLVPAVIDFNDLVVTNETDMWGLELMGLRRLQRISYGGHWELMGGVRFVNFDEQFHVEATGGILADSTWNNEAQNLIVGPQFGARWFKSCCRWTFAAETRFAPAVNFQAVRLRSTINDQRTTLNFQNSGFDSLHDYVFSPIGELRLNWGFQLTRAIAVTGGYSATYIGGLARPSNMVDYILPNLQLLRDNNYDDVFMHGITVGLELNR